MSANGGKIFRHARIAAFKLIFAALVTNAFAQSNDCPQPSLRTGDGRFDVCTQAGKIEFRATSSTARVDTFALKDRLGKPLSPIGLWEHKHRGSVIVVFRDSLECWELFFRSDGPEIFEGFVHDYRSGEGIAESGPVRLRRSQLPRLATGVKLTALPYIIVETAAAPFWFNLDVRRETMPPPSRQ